jgi:AmmeMemoRadiSam system protein B
MMKRNATAVAALALAVALWYALGSWSEDDHDAALPLFPSYFMQSSFVDGAFDAIGDVSARPDAALVLVNHHLLASHLIARVLGAVATDEPTAVVVVSPDHFASGIAPATSVIARWPTPYGTLEPGIGALTELASSGAVHLMELPFAREHGITNVTMFIARAVPNARLVPVIIRDDAPVNAVERLATSIAGLPGRVLVVGSFDFTHDATDAVARANDERSLGILQDGVPENAGGIVTDSRPGIRLLMRIAQLRELRFILSEMTNSARVLQQPGRTDVTSYITGFWAP